MTPTISPDERRAAMFDVLKGCRVRPPRVRYGRTVAAFVQKKNGTHLTKSQWNRCGKKCGYSTRRMAQRVMDAAFRDRGVRLRAYLCEMCGKWHITHSFRFTKE